MKNIHKKKKRQQNLLFGGEIQTLGGGEISLPKGPKKSL